MTRGPYHCRRCGTVVALVSKDEIQITGVTSTHRLRRREITVICPECSQPRTFTPPRTIEKIVTTKAV